MADFWAKHDQLIEEAIIQVIALVIKGYISFHYDKSLCRTASTGGDAYINELLDAGHAGRIQEVFRMLLHTFYSLVTWLEEHTSLKSSKGVSIQEKVAI